MNKQKKKHSISYQNVDGRNPNHLQDPLSLVVQKNDKDLETRSARYIQIDKIPEAKFDQDGENLKPLISARQIGNEGSPTKIPSHIKNSIQKMKDEGEIVADENNIIAQKHSLDTKGPIHHIG